MPWAVSALKLSANDEQVCLGHYGEKPVKLYIKKNVLNSYKRGCIICSTFNPRQSTLNPAPLLFSRQPLLLLLYPSVDAAR
jgi:hypothetical protein